MKNLFKGTITYILNKILFRINPDFISYSQEGEDKVLERFFEAKENGFYIDVGAHHPVRFSNTYKFYLKGWRGVNIDAMPGSMKEFEKKRPNDINVEAAISDADEILKYYAFNEPALNGFSKEISDERDGKAGYKIIFEKEINTQKLSDVLKKYVPVGQNIDFLSIDVEGLDYNVLKSNNWDVYRPVIVLVEILDFTEKEFDNKVYNYLREIGYSFFAKTGNTVFFKDSSDKN